MLSTQTTRSESDVSVITYHFCLEHLLSRRRPVTIMRVKNKRERVFMCSVAMVSSYSVMG